MTTQLLGFMLFNERQIPPKPPGYPFRLAFLPIGVSLDDVGGPSSRTCGLYLTDCDCSHGTMNDPAFADYLRQKVPVFVCAQRARDLRPFLRRAEQFARRGYRMEVLP